MTNRRKRQTNKEGGSEGAPEEYFFLEDMDLDVNIEDIEFINEEQQIWESREIIGELAKQETILFLEESLTLHNALFEKSSKKLVIEKIHAKNKKVQGKLCSELDLNGVPPSKIVHIHEAMGEALKIPV